MDYSYFLKFEREREARELVHNAMREVKAERLDTYKGALQLKYLRDEMLPCDLRWFPTLPGDEL